MSFPNRPSAKECRKRAAVAIERTERAARRTEANLTAWWEKRNADVGSLLADAAMWARRTEESMAKTLEMVAAEKRGEKKSPMDPLRNPAREARSVVTYAEWTAEAMEKIMNATDDPYHLGLALSYVEKASKAARAASKAARVGTKAGG